MLSEALRLLRVFHDMKQNELAQRLGISNSHVSEIEKGNRTPSFEVISKYATEFKVPVSSIVFFSEQLENAQSKSGVRSKTKQAIASKVINLLQLIESKTESDALR